MKTAIVIPARYASTRFPGKPLVKIAGMTMLERVVAVGRKAAGGDVDLMVATEDMRIADHCEDIGVTCVMTSDDCATGSDRVWEAVRNVRKKYDVIVSLQGDAPFTPPQAISKMIGAFRDNPRCQVATPVVRLRWVELDALRASKKKTPFSGTTAVIDENGTALWFSKNILPAIRREDKMRDQGEFSPVYQHLGLYAYRTAVLKKFVSLPPSPYEELEGLEQLRLLENGISIQTVTLKVPVGLAQAGIDSPADLKRAEALLAASRKKK